MISKHKQFICAYKVAVESQARFTRSIAWVGLSVIISALAGVLASVMLA